MSAPTIETTEPLTAPFPREGSRSETVYRALLSGIQDGRFPHDGKLPTENELTQHFQVSRPVVRAAIAKLREKGLVRSVQGSGTVVIYEGEQQAAAGRSEMSQGSVRDLQRCFEFRLLIESEAAYLAALRHGPQSLKRISECVYPASYSFPAVNPKPGETFGFHQAVVTAADNPFLDRAMGLILSQPGFQVYLRLRGAKRAPDPVEDRSMVNTEHREILRLIERRQADEAREFMRHHIRSAYDAVINRIPVTDNF